MSHKREVTIYDIAEKLNLSSSTVSRALKNNPVINTNTRKLVQDLAKALGYRRNTFASNLRKQNTHTIGVIVHELNSYFIASVLAGIEKISSQAGYDLIIMHSCESHEKEVANAQNLFHKRVDGVIASLAFNTHNLDHYREFEEKGIPVIFFDRVDEKSDAAKVIIDNYHCGYQATQHLIEQGCKRIVLVTGNLSRNVYALRYQGYRDALHDNGIEFNSGWLLIKDLREQCGATAAMQILDMRPLPDGAFFTNDFSAAVCMQTLKEQGIRIPQDIAIVGFNNDAVSKIIEPKLTTINYPGTEIGEIAANNLIDKLSGFSNPKQNQTVIVRSELIVRNSSLKKTSSFNTSFLPVKR